MNALRTALVLVGLAVLVGGCAAKRNTPVEEIPKLQKLSDVMDNQSTTADPEFEETATRQFLAGLSPRSVQEVPH